MMAKKYRELQKKLHADPKRREAIAIERSEALREHIEYRLEELRRLRELTQAEIAYAIGSHQPSISQLENADDFLVSTLRAYVEALGGTLHAYVEIDGEEFPLAM